MTPSTSSSPKFVSFSTTQDKLVQVHDMDAMTIDEGVSTWYNKDDYDRIKNDAQCTIQFVLDSDPQTKQYRSIMNERLEAKGYCLRGLENRVDPIAARRSAKDVARAWYAVMEEQARQTRKDILGEQDSENNSNNFQTLLANVYHGYTRTSQLQALRQGSNDEKEAFTAYKDGSSINTTAESIEELVKESVRLAAKAHMENISLRTRCLSEKGCEKEKVNGYACRRRRNRVTMGQKKRFSFLPFTEHDGRKNVWKNLLLGVPFFRVRVRSTGDNNG